MKSWTTKKLPEVLFIQEGPGIRKYEYEEGGYPMINVRCVQDGYIDMSKSKSASNQLATSKWKHFQVDEGDILYTISGTIGRSAIVKASDLPLLMNTSVVRFRSLTPDLDSNFVYYYFKTTSFINELLGHSTGTAIKNVGPSHLQKMNISYPPIPEQKRIVAILDQAFAYIEQARAKTEQNLKNARELFECYLQQVFSPSGEGWEKTTLGEATEGVYTGPFGSLLHKSDYVENGVPLVNPAHITNTGIEVDHRKTVDPKTAQRLSAYIMREGDIVIGRRGEMGRCAIISANEDGFLCGTGSFYIKASNRCDGEYLVRYLRSEICKARLERISGGAVMPNLSNSDLSNLSIHLPSVGKQREISDLIDKLSQQIENVISVYLKKLAALDELKKSILQKAFTGQLTAKDAA
ncbi:MAG TPA: hypothetical protein DIW43_17365 [Spongiibacteraceae bacterium]|nr:hypothetical protein [Spongiibacteraceae bacterium]HCS29230.1 hypothetical protein [Spongiibacteraceae bacterium]